MSDDDLLVLNGIDGATGDYLLPPMTPEDVLAVVGGREAEPLPRGVVYGVDTGSLAASGWGVIFPGSPGGAADELRAALRPLLEHRRSMVGARQAHRYRELEVLPGESKDDFLVRNGADGGAVDPDQMPYYLLIAGSPEEIPWRFQYQLDVQHAVGRISFPSPGGYARYARSVVAAEHGVARRERHVALFGPRNANDRATGLSSDLLLEPLAENLRQRVGRKGARGGWTVRTAVGREATKERLARLLGGDETPALLFTASHGMGFPAGDRRQLDRQGALLCQDWPGPVAWRRPIPPRHYFAANDVASDARVHGLVAFHFACYGAGTPRHDDFAHRKGPRDAVHRRAGEPAEIAPHDFMARLPQRLLGHPGGGALAVVGHVERAWGYSFMGKGSASQVKAFESALAMLLDGVPVGHALEVFNQRYAELSTDLTDAWQRLRYGQEVDRGGLVSLWTAHNDARSYVLLGDPAVRLAVGGA